MKNGGDLSLNVVSLLIIGTKVNVCAPLLLVVDLLPAHT